MDLNSGVYKLSEKFAGIARKTKRFLIPLIVIFLLSTGVWLGVSNLEKPQKISVKAETVELSYVTAKTTFNRNEEFWVNAYLDTKGLKVTGADLRVRYNPNILEAKEISKGNFLPVVFIPGSIDNGIGLAKIVLGSEPTTPKNGIGILARVKFLVKGGSGTTEISFGPATAVAAIGYTTNVVGQLTPLQINILAARPTPTSSPTATPTPTPTVTPTATATVTPTPTPTGGALVGDVNGDGVVNIIDIGILIDNYGSSPPTDPRADLNKDGIVNIIDIGIVIDNYGS